MRLLLFLDELCASIVRSHRETSQYRVEELQALRWKLFSREEIQAYQSKVCAQFSLHFYFLILRFLLHVCELTQTVSKQNMSFHMLYV